MTEAIAYRHVAWVFLMGSALFGVQGGAIAAPPIETYGRLPGIDLVQLSPSGERVAMIGVVGESRRLIVLSADRKLLQSGSVGDAKIRDLAWAGDDHLLLTASATADMRLDFGMKIEFAKVVQVSLAAKKAWTVFEDSKEIAHLVRGIYGTALKEGRWYGYFGGVTQLRQGSVFVLDHQYPDLYRVDLGTGEPKLEAKGADREREWVIDADGRITAHSDYNQGTGEWRLFAGRELHDALIKRADPTGDVDLLGLGRTPGTVLMVDTSGVHDVLEEINLSHGASQPLLGDQSITDYWFDRQSRLFLGAETIGASGAANSVFLDPALQARSDATRKAFPGLEVHIESFSQGLKTLVVKTEGVGDSGTFWLVDIASGKADPLGYEYPAIHPDDVGPMKMVRYRAADGLDLEGVLTLPPGREPKALPLIVMPHGGPIGVADRPGFDWWAQALASRGYAVFQPNFRGSSGYGRAFRDAGYGQWGGKMLSDIADGLAALAAQGIIDAQRACIVGASYGGYAALAGVTVQHGLYRCAVSVAGPANLQSFGGWMATHYGYVSETSRYWRKATGGDAGWGAAIRSVSPALLADKADAPILLIHGRDDSRVPIEQSEEMAGALKRAQKTFEFVDLPQEDHFLSREATRIAMLEATVRFVEKYNPPR